MANPQMLWQLSVSYFQRNNPVELALRTFVETVYNVATFQSKMRLLKYKISLAQKQLQSMESHVGSGSPYQARGSKFDRAY